MKDSISPAIVRKNERLFTYSKYHDSVFGEKLSREKGKTLREWIVKRSKLGVAILKGLGKFPISSTSNVLYLGASSGTTVSYVSDIVSDGIVYAVELSYDPFIKLLDLSMKRDNIIPILEDAGNPEKYRFMIEHVDCIYQDIAQRDQIRIFNENANAFPDAGWAFLVLKARSISARKSDSSILKENIARIENFNTVQVIDLKPYDVSNYMILLKRKR